MTFIDSFKELTLAPSDRGRAPSEVWLPYPCASARILEGRCGRERPAEVERRRRFRG